MDLVVECDLAVIGGGVGDLNFPGFCGGEGRARGEGVFGVGTVEYSSRKMGSGLRRAKSVYPTGIRKVCD